MKGFMLEEMEIRNLISAELNYVRRLGSSKQLIMVASNLGTFEAVLMILNDGDEGLPVYRAIESVQSRFSSQSGILKRLKLLRDEGVLVSRSGSKKSEVRLVVSSDIRSQLVPVLGRKSNF